MKSIEKISLQLNPINNGLCIKHTSLSTTTVQIVCAKVKMFIIATNHCIYLYILCIKYVDPVQPRAGRSDLTIHNPLPPSLPSRERVLLSMSVYGSFLSSLEDNEQVIECGREVGSVITRLASNDQLIANVDTQVLVNNVIDAASGGDRVEGYRLLVALLRSEVTVEESSLAGLFERLPSLLESAVEQGDMEESKQLLLIVDAVYQCGARSIIERIEKVSCFSKIFL